LQNGTLQINWNIITPLIIQATVTGANPIDVTFNITNANNYTTNVAYTNSNRTSALLTITYTPTRGEYPNFLITALDTQSLSSSAVLTGMLICDCQSLDSANQCLYESVQSIINPSISQVTCSCLQYYTGKKIGYFLFLNIQYFVIR
jgi:hypothetical protein